MSLRGEKRQEFPQSVRKAAFVRCCQQCNVEGVENIPGVPQCEGCGNELRSGGIIYEHDQADGLGGQPTDANCKVHCKTCADVKTFTEDNPRMAKADRALKKAFGLQAARQKIQSPGFRKSAPQRTASRPLQRKSEL